MTRAKFDLLATNVINIVLFVSIFCFGFIRWQKLEEIVTESNSSQERFKNIHSALINTVELTNLGEQVYGWTDDDVSLYNTKLSEADTLLDRLGSFYPAAKTDSMKYVLHEKGRLLIRIHETTVKRSENENRLTKNRPVTVKDSVTTIMHRTGHIFRSSSEEVTSKTKDRTVFVPSVNQAVMMEQAIYGMELCALNDSLSDVNRWLDVNMRRILNADIKTAEREQERLQAKASYIGHATFMWGMALLFIVFALNIGNSYRRARVMKKLENESDKNKRLIENRRRMMYSIVHDLRTPLGIIIGYNDMEKRAPQKNDKFISEISRATSQLKSMIDHMLDYFRLESERIELDCKNFNLIELQNDLINTFKMRAEDKRIDFVTPELQDKMLYGDCEKIRHIVTNLLDNAFKFTKEGKVCFRMSYPDNGNLYIEVKDTGIGIKPKDQEKIFEAFTKMPNAEAKGLDGLGIGLSIVKLLVDLMKGKITFRPEEKGSCFEVVIPIAGAVSEETPQPADAKKAVEVDKCVLVIDDNDHWLEMTKTMLEDNGIACDTCNDSAQVFTMMRDKEYSLVITDMKMPGLNGLELMKLMRKSRVGNSQSVPVVVSTSSGEETREELIAEGFDECLFKDFNTEELVKLVNRWIQEKTGTVSPDFTRLRKTTADSLIEDTEKSMANIHQFAKERNLEKVGWWAHHLRGSWVLYRVGVLLDPIVEAAIKKDESKWQQIEECISEADKMAEILISKAKELKGE
jgi:signal transduction histidine kinase/CheY-like chemotaxis protein